MLAIYEKNTIFLFLAKNRSQWPNETFHHVSATCAPSNDLLDSHFYIPASLASTRMQT
jgi:hypothetical protein